MLQDAQPDFTLLALLIRVGGARVVFPQNLIKTLWKNKQFSLLDIQSIRQPEILNLETDYPRLLAQVNAQPVLQSCVCAMLSRYLLAGGKLDAGADYKVINTLQEILGSGQQQLSEHLFGNVALALSEIFKQNPEVRDLSVLEKVAEQVLERGKKAGSTVVRKNAGVCLSCMIVFDDRLRRFIREGTDGLEFLASLNVK